MPVYEFRRKSVEYSLDPAPTEITEYNGVRFGPIATQCLQGIDTDGD